jgi:hypothetical protein
VKIKIGVLVDASVSTAPPGFDANIKPLFRERDRAAMKSAFDLWSYDDVRARASDILTQVRNGTMPCDGAWPSEHVQLFQRWVEAGMPQ